MMCERRTRSLTLVFAIERYMSIPVVSRMYLTGAFLTSAACAVDIVTPFSLYFNWGLIFKEGQVWRLVTSYLFFGVFSIDFLFHMYFLVSAMKPTRLRHMLSSHLARTRFDIAGYWRRGTFVEEQPILSC